MPPLLANAAVDLFLKGGPIMYPLLLAGLVAIAVVAERLLWWVRVAGRREPRAVAAALAAAETGDWAAAEKAVAQSADPVARVLRAGLAHRTGAFEGAVQVASAAELREAARYIGVLDTLVTLAPLLGLLGTVTGIMGSFNSIGSDELAVAKVTGGIGEALIATAAGLGIAIATLLPLNVLSARLAGLQADLEAAATALQVAVQKGRAS
ncbi:MAG: MotA/TolQ/ExbB proton channel family protein [Verrucomicrobia bacterium]|nr:MotA/TolQ/ExbB proton channel family protein [Verrucomicrobiota bacterium]